MTAALSMEAIVACLEKQIAHHREREAFHAEQGAYHGEQQALHAAELATLTSTLEAFKTSTAKATELASRDIATPAPSSAEPLRAATSMDIGRKPSLTRMVQRVIESRPPDESFGTNYLTAEINHRYGDRLRRPVKPKLVSIVLRRLAATGRLREVRKGRPHHEALYSRG
jgi:hypothetical protein